VEHYIPRWGRRVDIVTGKTDQVDKQKHHRQPEIGLTFAFEVEPVFSPVAPL